MSQQQNLDAWIEKVKRCEHLPETDFKKLCDMVKMLLVEEAAVQPVASPVTVCGDIHGQFHDLLQLFNVGGQIPDKSYIFMGDFVDRGCNSVETLTYLFLMKARHPSNITLIRGNHESRQITQVYGFYDECHRKYGSASIWKACCDVFDCMNIAAVIDGRVLCVHGGLSPLVNTLDKMRLIDRVQEIPHEVRIFRRMNCIPLWQCFQPNMKPPFLKFARTAFAPPVFTLHRAGSVLRSCLVRPRRHRRMANQPSRRRMAFWRQSC